LRRSQTAATTPFRLGQIGGSGKIAVMTPQTFRHKITVKGDPNILNYLASNLNLNQPGQVVKRSDPSDVHVTDEQRQLMRGGMPIQFGTTRLEISFNSNVEQIKSFIRENFPKLTVE
jgi:hypothetical protein